MMCLDFQKQYGSYIFTYDFVEEIIKYLKLYYIAWF
jgi:hypothetical protein